MTEFGDAGAGAEFQSKGREDEPEDCVLESRDVEAGAEFQAGSAFQCGAVNEGKDTEKVVRGKESRNTDTVDEFEKDGNPSSHQHAHCVTVSPCVSRGGGVGSVGSAGGGGSPCWARGRWSARLASSWCCPGCGLYGDGTLCMMCDGDFVHNSSRGNSKGNLRCERSQEHRGGIKTLRAGTGIQVGSPIVDNASGNASLADYLRWAPRRWPIEGWECRTVIKPFVEKVNCVLAGGCEVVSTIMRNSEWSPVSTGPGELLRTALGWTPLLRTPSSGVWLFRGAVRGEQLLAALEFSVDWVVRGTYRTACAVEPRCHCSYAYGRRIAVGPHTGCRSWELLQDLWRAIAPQMAPWCAAGDVPTCANLNYYGGPGSCVRWHSDDEAQIGGRGESKLIVSVSIGFSALFRWKPRPSPDCEADSTWLHHGDLLVMDGRCQDEYLHSTDPRLDGERVNITFRWLKNHVPQCPLGTGVMCCLPTCVKGLPIPVYAGLERLVWNFGGVLWFLLGMGLMLLAFLALVGLWHRKSRYFWVKLSSSLQVRVSPYVMQGKLLEYILV